MSMSVFFYPIVDETYIGHRSVYETLEEVFGSIPRDFTEDDLLKTSKCYTQVW
jgi:hypothetical protein